MKLAMTPGVGVTEAANRLGINPATLRHWISLHRRINTPTAVKAAEEIDEHRASIAVVIDEMVRNLLSRLPAKMEEATFTEVIDGVDRLLDRATALLTRPGQEQRSDLLVKALSEKATDPRVQAAVAEALVRRGHLVSLPGDDSASAPS